MQEKLNDQQEKLNKAQRSFQSQQNNVISVRGGEQQFAESLENLEISLEAERLKNQHLISALALIVQEFPDFSQVIEGPLAENGIKLPSRPMTA